MKEEKDVVVHDSVKELYDSIYEIFKESGGRTSWFEKILNVVIISAPITFLIADNFKFVYSFVFLIVFFLVIFNKRIGAYYEDKLKFRPSNVTIYEPFYSKCSIKHISLTVINNICDLVDSKIENKQNNDFFSPVVLAVLLSLCINCIDDLINDVKVTEAFMKYEFIIPLLVAIYVIVLFISTIEKRELSLLKKCLIYTKIKYDLKGEENISSDKESAGEEGVKQDKNL